MRVDQDRVLSVTQRVGRDRRREAIPGDCPPPESGADLVEWRHDAIIARGTRSAFGQKVASAREIGFVYEYFAPPAELQPALCGEIGDPVSAPDLLGAEHSAQNLRFALVRDDR
jgi:hypothetical protein